MRHPEEIRSSTHCGGSCPGSSASLISSTAWGNLVTSVRCTGSSGSLNHRFIVLHVGPFTGFSATMHRLVSREQRTEASNGTWNAVRMYMVLKVGSSCLDSTAFWTSVKSFLIPESSALDIPFMGELPGPELFRCFLASASIRRASSISHVCWPVRKGTTRSCGSVNRSFTLSSPVHDSLCVLRSTKTTPPVGSSPYQRSLMAMLCGCFCSLV